MRRPAGTVDLERRAVVKGLASLTAASALWPRELLAGEELRRGPTALVIGAGIAGLSAAYELRNAGFNVSIFEKEKFTGGRMVELQMGPLYQYTHAVGVWQGFREMFSLADEVGVLDGLRGPTVDGFGDIDNGHGVYDVSLPFRIDKVAQIPGMSPETKQKLPLLQPDLDEIRQEVNAELLATGAAYDDETVTQYFERVLGKKAADELIRFWIDPDLAGSGWPADTTSKIAELSIIADPEAGFMYPRDGIGVLTRKLGSMLPVQNNTTVRYITPPDATGRHTVHYLTPDFQRRSVKPDSRRARGGRKVPRQARAGDEPEAAGVREEHLLHQGSARLLHARPEARPEGIPGWRLYRDPSGSNQGQDELLVRDARWAGVRRLTTPRALRPVATGYAGVAGQRADHRRLLLPHDAALPSGAEAGAHRRHRQLHV